MKTTQRKIRILELVEALFGDTKEDEDTQADALEEIASLASARAEVLREQIRDRAAGDE